MSTESIVRPAPQVAARPLVGKLHEWVTTVDHKRLGILYITYALFFLIIGESKPRSCASSSFVHTVILSRRKFSTACSRCMGRP